MVVGGGGRRRGAAGAGGVGHGVGDDRVPGAEAAGGDGGRLGRGRRGEVHPGVVRVARVTTGGSEEQLLLVLRSNLQTFN